VTQAPALPENRNQHQIRPPDFDLILDEKHPWLQLLPIEFFKKTILKKFFESGKGDESERME
jgi:hypothetical protein